MKVIKLSIGALKSYGSYSNVNMNVELVLNKNDDKDKVAKETIKWINEVLDCQINAIEIADTLKSKKDLQVEKYE